MSVWGMIHSTAALFTIACLVLPFLAFGMGKLSHEKAAARAGKIGVWLRIVQFVLIISLITGFIRYGFHFTGWLVTVLVIFLAIAALMGIMGATAKRIRSAAEQNQDYSQNAAKFARLSLFLAIAIIAMLVVKFT